ncbi:MAG: recombinase family protein [Dehalococcoidales bacterium]|nr:recombinase family protein [Dehalococcoidales bacterium]
MIRNQSKPDRIQSFEDLRGLRGECYVRDSTLDQRDGFGPEIQKSNEERFALAYGIILGDRWYTEFVSGRSVSKRHEFQKIIEDARLDTFDVLLVDHTSRFGRNQAECIKYKEELQQLGKTVIFVSQGIISGSERDFLSERINETLDEQYSRNLSRYISEGLAIKAENGLHVGPVPLGYKSELISGRRERKVINPETMPALLLALREYATGDFSYFEVADHLNAHGYRTRYGRLFTGYNIKEIMANRFYDGRVVYHQGLPDEIVFEGIHEVPEEVKNLWNECQLIKRQRRTSKSGYPRQENHHYPFSRVLHCSCCGSIYHGEATYYKGQTNLRLSHERRSYGRHCDVKPKSQPVEFLNQQFCERVLPYMKLDNGWQELIIKALRSNETETSHVPEQRNRIMKALENLRKQHIWGDITDEEYRKERTNLERQLKYIVPETKPVELPNLEKAAELMKNLPELWSNEGVSNKQRESLIQEVFSKITIEGKSFVSIEPQPEYAPLFALKVLEYTDFNSPPPPPFF